MHSRGKEHILTIISSLFILLFVYTATGKLTDFTHFKNVLSHSPLIGGKAVYIAWLVPATELLASILLLLPRTRAAGLYISMAMMVVFSGYIAYMLAFSVKLPCPCGGVLSLLSWKQHLIFNICFTILAFTGCIILRKKLPVPAGI